MFRVALSSLVSRSQASSPPLNLGTGFSPSFNILMPGLSSMFCRPSSTFSSPLPTFPFLVPTASFHLLCSSLSLCTWEKLLTNRQGDNSEHITPELTPVPCKSQDKLSLDLFCILPVLASRLPASWGRDLLHLCHSEEWAGHLAALHRDFWAAACQFQTAIGALRFSPALEADLFLSERGASCYGETVAPEL